MTYGHGPEITTTLTNWLPLAWAEINEDLELAS